jgi:glycogen operon protein
MASRIAGSSDIFSASDRGVYASINFITAHDGYTLRDLVSYEQKHNDANGENNQDGHNDNISRNWGAEGEVDDPEIIELRYRPDAYLSGDAGVLAGGADARARRRGRADAAGNNNAYAQDNELTWMPWDLTSSRSSCRRSRASCWRCGRHTPCCAVVISSRALLEGSKRKDVTWLRPDGKEIKDADWGDPDLQCFGMLIDGMATDEVDDRGHVVSGDTLLILLNGGETPVRFTLPALGEMKIWVVMVDTAKHELPVVRRGRVTVDPAHADAAALRHGPPNRDERRRAARPAHAEGATHTMSDR